MKNFYLLKEEEFYRTRFTYDSKEFLKCGIINVEDLEDVINKNIVNKYRKVPAFKSGDVVQLTSVRPSQWNSFGGMDHLLGRIVTVEFFGSEEVTFIESYTKGWTFKINCIENVMGNN